MTTRRGSEPTSTPRRRYTDREWHFEKRLTLDTLVAIAGIALVVGVPVLVWGRAMESRVLALEVIQVERQKGEASRDTDAREQRIAITSRLDKLDDKVTQMQIQIGQIVPAAKTR